ncbi:MAG: Mu-like prophage major head subunit gpT family protein [Acidobacteriota bacterium]|nr:Mu-like prophage major head subunit gpT family protein [Acidobacteriota bacterium]
MLVNRSNLQIIFRNLKTSFQKSFDAAEVQWPKFAMLIPSTGELNDYSWIEYFPKMREWVGEKVIKSLSGKRYELRNKDFEATIEVDRNHIEDDQLGIYRPMAEMAGYSARQLPDELMFAVLSGGWNGECFDGKKFYADDHPVGGGAASNQFTKALDVSTYAKAKESYGAAVVRMQNFKDDEGRPLNIMPNVLVVPPALRDSARVLMSAEFFKNREPNPYRGECVVVSDPRLATATEWHLLDTSKPMGALIYQERKKPVFLEQTDMSGGSAPDSVFMQRKYRYSVECRGAGGYGFWQMAHGSKGTG